MRRARSPARTRKRIAAAAVVAIVLVAAGLLPLRTELSGGPDLFTADGLAAGLGELRGVSANHDQIYIEQGVLHGQIGSRSVIHRDGDLTTGPHEAPGPDPKYVFDLGEVDFATIPGLIDLARQRFPGGGQVAVYVSRPVGGGPVEIVVRVDLPTPNGAGQLLADASGKPRG